MAENETDTQHQPRDRSQLALAVSYEVSEQMKSLREEYDKRHFEDQKQRAELTELVKDTNEMVREVKKQISGDGVNRGLANRLEVVEIKARENAEYVKAGKVIRKALAWVIATLISIAGIIAIVMA